MLFDVIEFTKGMAKSYRGQPAIEHCWINNFLLGNFNIAITVLMTFWNLFFFSDLSTMQAELVSIISVPQQLSTPTTPVSTKTLLARELQPLNSTPKSVHPLANSDEISSDQVCVCVRYYILLCYTICHKSDKQLHG